MEDIVFYNGHFLSFDSNIGLTTIRVVDKTIRETGTFESIKPSTNEQTRWIDMKGKCIAPGFFDSHIHIWKVGALLTDTLNLRGVKSITELQHKLQNFARDNPHALWIKARGFNEIFFEENRLPTAQDLDKAISNKPVFLQRTCAHIAVLNNAAMKLAGINTDSPEVFGGTIYRDENNAPNGILSETAIGLVTKHMPQPTSREYENMILTACHMLLKHGITCATDPAVHPELLSEYIRLDKEKKLPIRICAIPILLPDGGDEAYPLPEIYRSDFLRVDTVKFFADGGLSGKTAAMNTAYLNGSDKGILRLTPDRFYPLAKQAQDAGFQIATHAIGDRAIDVVLETYENIYDPSFRIGHRIEHFGIAQPSHLKRAKKLNVHIVSQPVFLRELGYNFRQSLPPELLNIVYSYKSILDEGINLAFSTDAPVVSNVSALSCAADAILRQEETECTILGERQRISVKEAFLCYTLGSAKASGMEAFYGSFAPGKKADFVVLSENILEIKPENLSDVAVEQVWVDGQLVIGKM